MSLRQRLHDWSLLGFALLAFQLLWVLLAGQLGLLLGQALGPSVGSPARLASAFLVLDLSKLPLLLAGGWLLSRLTLLGTWRLVLALLLGSYGLELGLGLLLGQGAWLLAGCSVVLARLGGAALVGGLLVWALRRWCSRDEPAGKKP